MVTWVINFSLKNGKCITMKYDSRQTNCKDLANELKKNNSHDEHWIEGINLHEKKYCSLRMEDVSIFEIANP